MATMSGLVMASSPGSTAHGAKPVFRTVKLFDLGLAPAFIQDAIRPIALVHLNKVDGAAIWDVTVGSYDWQDAAEEWALHRWLRENGATEGENVLLQADDLT
jgi:hypothetical protein